MGSSRIALATLVGKVVRGEKAATPAAATFVPPARPPARRAFKPDIIHCSSPGIMWLAALIYSRLLKAPLVYSYHTHVPEYMPRLAKHCHLRTHLMHSAGTPAGDRLIAVSHQGWCPTYSAPPVCCLCCLSLLSTACRYAMTLFISAMWAIIRFFHAAAHLTLVTSGVMAAELAAQVHRHCRPPQPPTPRGCPQCVHNL